MSLKTKSKAFALGIVVATISFTILLLFAELVIRIFYPCPLIPRYVTNSGFGVRVHSSNIVTHHTTPDYRIKVQTNSLGIRGDKEITFTKPANVFRVLLLGDSFTFGYGVDVEQTYGALIESTLREKGINAEVINLGVSGFGTAEELVMLNKRGLKFDPDLVIVGFCRNDHLNNVLSLLYVIDNSGQLVRKNEEYLPAIKERDFLYSFALYRFLAERSHLLYFVREKISTIVMQNIRNRNIQVINADTGKIVTKDKAIIKEKERQLTAALLDEIKRTCVNNNINFCILDIPGGKQFTSSLPYDNLTFVNRDEIIDPAPVFKNESANKKLYWTQSAGHWTPEGHKIASELLVDWILAQYPHLLPKTPEYGDLN